MVVIGVHRCTVIVTSTARSEFCVSRKPYSDAWWSTITPPVIDAPLPIEPLVTPLYQSVSAPSATLFGRSAVSPPICTPPTFTANDSCVCAAVARLGTDPSW